MDSGLQNGARMRLPITLALLSTTALARADDDLGMPLYDYEPSSSVLGVVFSPSNGLSAGVVAGVTGVVGDETAEPAVTIGGHLATPGVTDSCRYLRLEGGYVLGDTGGATAAIESCLFRAGKVGVTAPGLTVRQDLAYEARPALSASRTLLARRYTGGTLRVDGSVFEGMSSPEWGSALMSYRVELDQIDQGDRRQRRWGLSIDTVRYLPPRAIVWDGTIQDPKVIVGLPADELSFLGVFIRDAWQGRYHVKAGGLMFARLVGYEAPNGLVVDAELKLGGGDVWEYDEMGEPDVQRVSVFTPTGYAGVAGALGRLGWSVRYSRDLYPAFDGALVLEDRLDGALDLAGITLAGYTAYTQVGAVGTTSAWTGGASLSRGFDLGDHASLLLAAEAGRSWYARVDTADAPRPEPAARAWATVAAAL